MNTESRAKYWRFYGLSLAALLLLGAYPLLGGARMAALSLQNGALEPGQYVKYVVPYAAICFALVLFAALQPLCLRLRRLAFPLGAAGAVGIFFIVEQFFESIQVHTTGMALIDASTLSSGAPAGATADLWQAALCIVSPVMQEQSLTYAAQDRFFYVIGNSAYKIHYYFISLLLIVMGCALIYGIGRLLRAGGGADDSAQRKKALMLQGMSVMALVALCVFANTTAFFRQAAPIQTPLASVLTCLFFVALGASAGVYAGSLLLRRQPRVGVGLPALIAALVTAAMYIGEAVMMGGNLYRFGTGWFFAGLPGIAVAPADILVVLLAAAVTWLTLGAARRHARWPGARTTAVTVALCAAIALGGVAFSAAAPKPEDDVLGCYVFAENVYTNPLSSSLAMRENMPYIYGLSGDALIIANTETGEVRRFFAQYQKTPVAEDEFTSKASFSFELPSLSRYSERYLRAIISDDMPQYGLYQMDAEIWLVELRGGIWSIYSLQKTDMQLSDLERMMDQN